MMLGLGLKSLLNRRFTVALTIASIAISVALIVGVERLRTQTREGFANSASGIDLIVAARGNPVQILMATVFGTGSTNATLDWRSFKTVAALPEVAWAVPVSMGDNHHGYPVIGTTPDYFDRLRHSAGQPLAFAKGRRFADHDEAVVGAGVAERLGYAPGSVIVNAHGAGDVSFDLHDDAPFTVSGVLAPTGTAVDRMVLVPLEGFNHIHETRQRPKDDPFAAAPSGEAGGQGGSAINAIFVGLTKRSAVLGIQRSLSTAPGEALTAVMPNVALLELWSITGVAENAMRLMAGAVALAGILGMLVMLFSVLEARRREFAILRSVGATPARIFGLIVLEAMLVVCTGIGLGLALLYLVILIVDPMLATRFGIRMGVGAPDWTELRLILVILGIGILASLLPAYRVYRYTLADGLSMKM